MDIRFFDRYEVVHYAISSMQSERYKKETTSNKPLTTQQHRSKKTNQIIDF